MSKNSKSIYEICRKSAGYTQEEAASLLFVGVRTLHTYENGGKVPDDVVLRMVKAYNAPLLGWEHLRENNDILAEILPEIIMPQTHGDMFLHMSLSGDDMKKSIEIVKMILSDGKLEFHELPDFEESMNLVDNTIGKLFAVRVYGRQIKNSMEQEMTSVG